MTTKKTSNFPLVLAVLFGVLHLFLAFSVWNLGHRTEGGPVPNLTLGPWSFYILLLLDFPVAILMGLVAKAAHLSENFFWVSVVALSTVLYVGLGVWFGKSLTRRE